MSKTQVDVSGLERLIRETPDKAETWLDAVAEDIVTDIVLSFGTSPPGETYQRGSVSHVASQPGYPPNVDIGTLSNSIKQEKTGELERTVSDGVEYGILQEDGTEYIAPRPFMRPAFDRAASKIEQDAARNLGLER